jgi:putative NIF3 family GTP cyclohydrolase 1 type 2
MNVKEIVDEIIRECKTPLLEKTCDLPMAGEWQNEVTGIATTFMATVDVIRESIARGANLIILGHNRTEEVGMKHLPEWLEKPFPAMPVRFIKSGEPFEYR